MHPRFRNRLTRSEWDRRHDVHRPGGPPSPEPLQPEPPRETSLGAVLALAVLLAVLLVAAFILSRLPS